MNNSLLDMGFQFADAERAIDLLSNGTPKTEHQKQILWDIVFKPMTPIIELIYDKSFKSNFENCGEYIP